MSNFFKKAYLRKKLQLTKLWKTAFKKGRNKHLDNRGQKKLQKGRHKQLLSKLLKILQAFRVSDTILNPFKSRTKSL